MRRALLSLISVLLPLSAAAQDAALSAVIHARTHAAGVFDGRPLRLPLAEPVYPDHSERRPLALDERQAPEQAAPAAAPRPARGVSSGYLGLYPESGFELGTGRCADCRGPREGKWYFLDELIATPKTGKEALVWIGSPELFEGAVLSDDGQSVRLADGSVVPFSLVPRIATNRSYYNPESLKHLKGRPLRIRGEMVGGTLVARTLWPEQWSLYPVEAADAATGEQVDALVAADEGGAKGPFQSKLLWGTKGPWDGKPVMGFMLNGAQGDDDESLGGHFSFFTGRVGPGGSMADWMFDNFYSMDSYSEKGIVAAMVPMDKYMADLNSGQSWYRPTYMLVLVMKDERVPLELQETFKTAYADYYAQRVKYDKTTNPCTALIVDPLRRSGWNYPEMGKTPSLVARIVSGLAGISDGDTRRELYRILRQEPTHLYPRAAFQSLSGDVLSMTGTYGADMAGREYTPLEKRIAEDLEAVIFVRIPQIPSSRKLGRDPVTGFMDYFGRVPLDRSKWETVPSVPRPFPPPGVSRSVGLALN